MLILSRKPGENIRLFLEDGREITIEVLSVGSRAVRIGIDAPKSINIVRGELLAYDDLSNEIEHIISVESRTQ
jgi:carbon storage regulator